MAEQIILGWDDNMDDNGVTRVKVIVTIEAEMTLSRLGSLTEALMAQTPATGRLTIEVEGK